MNTAEASCFYGMQQAVGWVVADLSQCMIVIWALSTDAALIVWADLGQILHWHTVGMRNSLLSYAKLHRQAMLG